MSTQKQCVTCSKTGSTMTCNGCSRTFCVKHVLEHQQELATQLDGIMREHDLLQQELGQTSDQHHLFENINQWENESITKIQVAAEMARTDLQQILERSKNELSKACDEIAANVRVSRESDDFSENELNRWKQKLEELKLEMTSPSSVQLIKDEQSAIHLITVSEKQTPDTSSASNSIIRERFSKVTGPVVLSEGAIAAKLRKAFRYAYVLGEQLYFQDRHSVRLRIDNNESPYNIFLGCISLELAERELQYDSPFVVGWFGNDEVRRHGSVDRASEKHGYKSNEIAKNDVLQLTFDCQQRQIELLHERTNKQHTLKVDLDKAPFPWQLLIAFCHADDAVRILP